jgi:hypothetical protein
MTKIPLPPMPHTDSGWIGLQPHELRARDLEVAKAVQEACVRVLENHQIPVGNSAAGEMACDWTFDALNECRDKINELEFDV